MLKVNDPNWKPSRGSRYYYCELYLIHKRTNTVESFTPCDTPLSECGTCEFNIKPKPAPPVCDWDDPDAVRAYARNHMRAIRKKAKEKIDDETKHVRDLNWKPTPGSKYYHCRRYRTARMYPKIMAKYIPCKKPKSACATCTGYQKHGSFDIF